MSKTKLKTWKTLLAVVSALIFIVLQFLLPNSQTDKNQSAGACDSFQKVTPWQAVESPEEMSTSAAKRWLDTLTVENEHHKNCYDRDTWPHWAPASTPSCSVREFVLARDATPPTSNCSSFNGVSWISIYDNKKVKNRDDMHIDHIVALSEANASGGFNWTEESKALYANDVVGLIAVSATSNTQKSDLDAAEWRPGSCEEMNCPGKTTVQWKGVVDNTEIGYSTEQWCWFAKANIAVKARWRLSVDQAESVALNDLLTFC